jgi:acyl-coenzyme A thioesterase PaaI-like protein
MSLAATEAELRRVLAEVAFTRAYGFRLEAIADGQCTLEVPFQAAFERPGGIVSGTTVREMSSGWSACGILCTGRRSASRA